MDVKGYVQRLATRLPHAHTHMHTHCCNYYINFLIHLFSFFFHIGDFHCCVPTGSKPENRYVTVPVPDQTNLITLYTFQLLANFTGDHSVLMNCTDCLKSFNSSVEVRHVLYPCLWRGEICWDLNNNDIVYFSVYFPPLSSSLFPSLAFPSLLFPTFLP